MQKAMMEVFQALPEAPRTVGRHCFLNYVTVHVPCDLQSTRKRPENSGAVAHQYSPESCHSSRVPQDSQGWLQAHNELPHCFPWKQSNSGNPSTLEAQVATRGVLKPLRLAYFVLWT